MADFDIKPIIDLARSGEPGVAEIVEPSIRSGGIPVAVLPSSDGGATVSSVKKLLDEWRTAPERREGKARALTIASFIDMVNRHKDQHSVVFADIVSKSPVLTAVLDYHQTDGAPRFGRHKISYEYPVSEEWAAWREWNGKVMSQEDFARFIVDRVADLAAIDPDEAKKLEELFSTKTASPAELIQLSRGLSMTVSIAVKEIRTLQSGEAQIVYEEAHKDGSGHPLKVPGVFSINIPLFVGAAPTRLVALLRYRRDGGIKWSYHLWRVADAMRGTLENDLDLVMAMTSLPVFEGHPEA